MRISDWSPDVCSSDLSRHDRRIIGQTSDIADERAIDLQRIDGELPKVRQRRKARSEIIKRDIDPIFVQLPDRTFGIFPPASQPRKSVVEGKSESVSVDHCGSHSLKKKKTKYK